jgi:hypothetical protein
VSRAVEEVTMKAAADKGAADMSTAGEAAVSGAAVGATGDSPKPDMTPSLVAGRAATPSGSTPLAKRPYRGVWNLGLSNLVFLCSKASF